MHDMLPPGHMCLFWRLLVGTLGCVLHSCERDHVAIYVLCGMVRFMPCFMSPVHAIMTSHRANGH